MHLDILRRHVESAWPTISRRHARRAPAATLEWAIEQGIGSTDQKIVSVYQLARCFLDNHRRR
jgi:hypothetical protein